MSAGTISVTPSILSYLDQVGFQEDELLVALREETATMPMARMQISPLQGQFMSILTAATGARRVVEIGTFTGYSSICMARALPSDGELIACDMSAPWTDVARKYWERAGLSSKIQLRIAPALDTLDALIADAQTGTFDLAFIDADKANYPHYFERCLKLVRAGGLILFDNTLWSGKVCDEGVDDTDTNALRALNAGLQQDDRVEVVLLPVGDGLSIARVK